MNLSCDQQKKIRDSFSHGSLKIRSVSPDGNLEWKRITHVHRHEVPWEDIVEVQTETGSMTLTGGHKVFVSPTEKVEAEKLQPGDKVLSVINEQVGYSTVLDVISKPSRQYMYDLTAADWHNFTLSGCNVTVSNSPDRNYHFRPPEHEGVIGNYNRVFGFVWEDYELLEYLKFALDLWNSFPPNTGSLCSIELLLQTRPEWKAWIMWGAIAWAANALAFNWIQEEFSIDYHDLVDVVLPSGETHSIKIGELYDCCK